MIPEKDGYSVMMKDKEEPISSLDSSLPNSLYQLLKQFPSP